MEKLAYRIVRKIARPDLDSNPDGISNTANQVDTVLIPVEAFWYFMLFCDQTQRSVWDTALHNRLRAALREDGNSRSCVSMSYSIFLERKNYTQRFMNNKLRPEELALAREMQAFGVEVPVREAHEDGGVKMWTNVTISVPSTEVRTIDWLDSCGRARTRGADGFVYRGLVGYTARMVYAQVVQFRLPTALPESTAVITLMLPTMMGQAGVKVMLAQVIANPRIVVLEPRRGEIHLPSVVCECVQQNLFANFPKKEMGAVMREMCHSPVVGNNNVFVHSVLNIHHHEAKGPEEESWYRSVAVMFNHPFFMQLHVDQHLVFAAMIEGIK